MRAYLIFRTTLYSREAEILKISFIDMLKLFDDYLPLCLTTIHNAKVNTSLSRSKLISNMAPCKRQVKAKRNLICSSCDSWIDFAKSGCVNSWAEVQADDFHFVCRGCTTVKYLQEQVIELRRMILMMTGQGETEVSRGGENDESRGGETEESRGGETEESRGGETEENKESSGNVREKAGKKKKDDRRQRMQQKRGKRVSGEGLPGGKTVKVDDMRERGHTSSV